MSKSKKADQATVTRTADSEAPKNMLLAVMTEAKYSNTRRVKFAYSFMYNACTKNAPGSKLFLFAIAKADKCIPSTDRELRAAVKDLDNGFANNIEEFLCRLANFLFLPPEWLLADAHGLVDNAYLGSAAKSFLTPAAMKRLAAMEVSLLEKEDYAGLAKTSVLSVAQWKAIHAAIKKVAKKQARLKGIKADTKIYKDLYTDMSETKTLLAKKRKLLVRSSKEVEKDKTLSDRKKAKTAKKTAKKLQKFDDALKEVARRKATCEKHLVELEDEHTALNSIGECMPADPREANLFVTSIFHWSASEQTYPNCLQRVNNKIQGSIIARFYNASQRDDAPDPYTQAMSVLKNAVRAGEVRIDYDKIMAFDGGKTQLFEIDRSVSALAVFSPYTVRNLIIGYATFDAYQEEQAERERSAKNKKPTSATRKTRRKRASKTGNTEADAFLSNARNLLESSSSSSSSGSGSDEDDVAGDLEPKKVAAEVSSSSSSSSDSDSDYPVISQLPLRTPSKSYADIGAPPMPSQAKKRDRSEADSAKRSAESSATKGPAKKRPRTNVPAANNDDLADNAAEEVEEEKVVVVSNKRKLDALEGSIEKPSKKKLKSTEAAVESVLESVADDDEHVDAETDTNAPFVIPGDDMAMDEIIEHMLLHFGSENPGTFAKMTQATVVEAIGEARLATSEPEYHQRYFAPFPNGVLTPNGEQLHDAYKAIKKTPGLRSSIQPSVLIEAAYVALHANRISGSIALNILDKTASDESTSERAIVEAFQDPLELQFMATSYATLHDSINLISAFYGTDISTSTNPTPFAIA